MRIYGYVLESFAFFSLDYLYKRVRGAYVLANIKKRNKIQKKYMFSLKYLK